MKTLLLPYVRYNQWANDRLLNFISANCSNEQLNTEMKSSFHTICTTLLHIWGAESIWLMRLKGESPTTWKWMEFQGTLADLFGEMIAVGKEWVDFVETCGDAFLSSNFHYKTLDGKEHTSRVCDAIQHCINHSTFHRGQLVTMLRQLGFTKLVSTDFIAFTRE